MFGIILFSGLAMLGLMSLGFAFGFWLGERAHHRAQNDTPAH